MPKLKTKRNTKRMKRMKRKGKSKKMRGGIGLNRNPLNVLNLKPKNGSSLNLRVNNAKILNERLNEQTDVNAAGTLQSRANNALGTSKTSVTSLTNSASGFSKNISSYMPSLPW